MHNYDIECDNSRIFFNFISTRNGALTIQEIGNMFDNGDVCITCGGYIKLNDSTHTVWGVGSMYYDADAEALCTTVRYDDKSNTIDIKQGDINVNIFKVI